MKEDALLKWLIDMRLRHGIKLVTGPRGWGKSTQLKAFRQWLLEQNVPSDRILLLNAEQAPLNRFTTTGQVLDFVDQELAIKNWVYILIQEAGSLPEPAATLSALLGTFSYNVFATASSKHFLPDILKSSPDKTFCFACAPRMLPRETAMRRWSEAILHDALMPSRIVDAALLVRTVRLLSDLLGDPVSLRSIGSVISPRGRFVSPHTIDNYLSILEASHLVEKCLVYDDFEDVVLNRGYRYFFTDLNLRQEVFGPSPTDDARRVNLNSAWIELRSHVDQVYLASKDCEADFITRLGNGPLVYWRADAGGAKVISGGENANLDFAHAQSQSRNV